MVTIDRGARGIALIVDENKRLVATVTDGDVRRAILAGLTLNDHLTQLLERKALTASAKPLVALYGRRRGGELCSRECGSAASGTSPSWTQKAS